MALEENTEIIKFDIPMMGNIEMMTAATIALQHRGRELRAEFRAIEPDGSKEQAKKWTELKQIDDELKNVMDRVEKASHSFSACDRILIQLAAERKDFKSLYKEKWDKFTEIRDANLPPEPKHTYIIELSEATEKQLMKVLKSLVKDGIEYRYGEPTTDAQFIAAKNLIKEIKL